MHQTNQTSYAQACLGVVISFVYAGFMGPISYTIIAETSAVRLRALSTGVGRAAYYVAEIPMIFLASQMLNQTGWNLAGKCGYVWGGTACVCWILAYFFLPELKGRSYREIDILFHRKVPARQFKKTHIDVTENGERLYQQVASRIEGLIEGGTLGIGTRVPSVRKLSEQQGVSISTALQAYRMLESEGLIEARPQSGYYVRRRRAARSETQRSLDFNGRADYREALQKELDAIDNLEIWRAGKAVRSLRPENN